MTRVLTYLHANTAALRCTEFRLGTAGAGRRPAGDLGSAVMRNDRGADRQRFTNYVRSTRPWLHREAYRLCHDWHEAEDLVQVTLYKVYRRWDQLDEKEQLTAYTRRTLLSAYVSEHRRSRWKYEVSHAQIPDRADRAATATVDERMTLTALLRRLGARQRAVLILRFYAGLSVEQAATALGCSPGTITSQTHRALRAVRDEGGPS